MNITAVVLAAGTSSRYGQTDGAPVNKLLLPFGDSCVVRSAVQTLVDAGLTDVLVVTGHQHEAVQAALATGPAVRFVHNPRFREGEMVSSIQSALRHLEHDPADGALITLGDMPLVPVAIIRRLIDAYARNCGGIVAPRVGQQRGHPVLLGRAYWQDALALPDGAPMRQLLAKHAAHVALLQVNTELVLQDVDTPALYASARTLAGR
jgi:molybdenum cofactor cytidylyltransferase